MSACASYHPKSVSLWMHNGLHWQSTAWGSFLPPCVQTEPCLLKPDQYKGLFIPQRKKNKKKLPSTPAEHRYVNREMKNFEINTFIIDWSGPGQQANMFYTNTWTSCLETWLDVHRRMSTCVTMSTWRISSCLWVQVRSQLKVMSQVPSIEETLHSFTCRFIHSCIGCEFWREASKAQETFGAWNWFDFQEHLI